MDACPHCGGRSGYSCVRLTRDAIEGNWGERGDAVCTEEERLHAYSKCIDCGKRVKTDQAQGLDHD